MTRFPIEETKETHTINSWYWIKFAKIHFWYWCCIFVEILCSPPPLRHDRCSPLHRGVRAVNWPNELSSIFTSKKHHPPPSSVTSMRTSEAELIESLQSIELSKFRHRSVKQQHKLALRSESLGPGFVRLSATHTTSVPQHQSGASLSSQLSAYRDDDDGHCYARRAVDNDHAAQVLSAETTESPHVTNLQGGDSQPRLTCARPLPSLNVQPACRSITLDQRTSVTAVLDVQARRYLFLMLALHILSALHLLVLAVSQASAWPVAGDADTMAQSH